MGRQQPRLFPIREAQALRRREQLGAQVWSVVPCPITRTAWRCRQGGHPRSKASCCHRACAPGPGVVHRGVHYRVAPDRTTARQITKGPLGRLGLGASGRCMSPSGAVGRRGQLFLFSLTYCTLSLFLFIFFPESYFSRYGFVDLRAKRRESPYCKMINHKKESVHWGVIFYCYIRWSNVQTIKQDLNG